jgi:single-strand DNA-binding protein
MNKVIMIGRLVRDPEIRYTQTGKAVASMYLAVDRRFSRQAQENGQQTADFIPLVAWNKLAEICGNNLAKGRRIGIEGRLQSRNYETKDGQKRTALEVVVDELEFLDSRNGQPGSSAPQAAVQPNAASQPAAPASDPGGFGSESISDEDIPF